ncbi:hypothetical protein VIGAN_10083600 [Vigna angularis var. angularis]|uniref:Uncharacterized protein n=1 Tax=Vigna angularis var. angularis TaxID=157739 RepID=A0A0S3T2E6_PHAAN|nr:hypothetical protein VIGAN_10083600 [Vigna angularis var. angularis]
MNKNLNGKMYNTNLEDNKNPSIILHPSSDLFSSSSHHELTASPLHPPTNPPPKFFFSPFLYQWLDEALLHVFLTLASMSM